MMRCSVASARGTSSTIRPLATTRIRSLAAITSVSSDEISRTATPVSASVPIRRWISAFDGTSIPAVGSSRISTFGAMARLLASTTFCWFPPLRVITSRLSSAGRTFRRSTRPLTNVRSRPRSMIRNSGERP